MTNVYVNGGWKNGAKKDPFQVVYRKKIDELDGKKRMFVRRYLDDLSQPGESFRHRLDSSLRRNKNEELPPVQTRSSLKKIRRIVYRNGNIGIDGMLPV